MSKRFKSNNCAIEKCLEKWHDNALDRGEKCRYETALFSLIKCPLKFESPRDCILLLGFDQDLCEKLNDELPGFCPDASGRDSCDPIIRVSHGSKTNHHHHHHHHIGNDAKVFPKLSSSSSSSHQIYIDITAFRVKKSIIFFTWYFYLYLNFEFLISHISQCPMSDLFSCIWYCFFLFLLFLGIYLQCQ